MNQVQAISISCSQKEASKSTTTSMQRIGNNHYSMLMIVGVVMIVVVVVVVVAAAAMLNKIDETLSLPPQLLMQLILAYTAGELSLNFMPLSRSSITHRGGNDQDSLPRSCEC